MISSTVQPLVQAVVQPVVESRCFSQKSLSPLLRWFRAHDLEHRVARSQRGKELWGGCQQSLDNWGLHSENCRKWGHPRENGEAQGTNSKGEIVRSTRVSVDDSEPHNLDGKSLPLGEARSII